MCYESCSASNVPQPVTSVFSHFFLVGGSAYGRGNVQQMAQESVRFHAWDKLMCNDSGTGNMVLEEV
jgi:hypothetical protein